MSIKHFKSLLFKSSQIQAEIEKESSQKSQNWVRLLKLKKMRLAIKDRLHRMYQEHANSIMDRRKKKTKLFQKNDWKNA